MLTVVCRVVLFCAEVHCVVSRCRIVLCHALRCYIACCVYNAFTCVADALCMLWCITGSLLFVCVGMHSLCRLVMRCVVLLYVVRLL